MSNEKAIWDAMNTTYDKLIRTIRPRISIPVYKMVDLQFVPFVWKTATTIFTGEISLLDKRV